MEKLDELKQFLSTPKKVAIIPHRKPDADALGSCLGLYWFLKAHGHEPVVVSPTDYPKFLHWMPGNETVKIYTESAQKQECEQLLAQADLIACLDFSGLNRIEVLKDLVSESKAQKLVIDHHHGKENFADFELWDTKAAATAELIYDFMKLFGREDLLTVDIASCLYAGIMTDTGSFKFPNTSPKVHRSVAEFLELGIDHARIHRLIYDNARLGRLQLLGFSLCHRLEVLPQFRTAYFALSEEDLMQYGYETGDTEGLVNYALSVENIVFAVLFIEDRGHVKMSLRSVGDFAVNEIANEHYNGGGHNNAAGGRIKGSLGEILNHFIGILPDHKKDLLAVKN